MAEQAQEQDTEGEILVSGIVVNQRYVQHVLIKPLPDGYYLVTNADESFRRRVVTMAQALRVGEVYLQAYTDGYMDGLTHDDTTPKPSRS